MSDKIADRLLGALSQSNMTLTGQLNKHKQKENMGQKDPEIADDKKSDELLPDMRKDRAASIAKRRQRPDVPSRPLSEESSTLSPSELETITDFGVYDPYSNEKVKIRKKKAREEAAKKNKRKSDKKSREVESAEVEEMKSESTELELGSDDVVPEDMGSEKVVETPVVAIRVDSGEY
uniref:Uncharacterized protein n=1 Tax=Ciona savignyi TaxID=51511 RepID=H2ZPK4_CIOSA